MALYAALVKHHVAVVPLEAIGDAFWADNPRRNRLFFVKGLPPAAPQRTHLVHLAETNSEMWRRLLFRDYLRANKGEALRYAALKREVANRYDSDREAYTQAKSPYVQEAMTKAMTCAS